jgi:hypothetical protein
VSVIAWAPSVWSRQTRRGNHQEVRGSVLRGSGARVARRVVGPATGLVLSLCAACGHVPAGPDRATPVVSLILIADESLHTATITQAGRADSAFPAEPVPIGPERVDLRVIDDAGGVHPLVPDSTAGRYRVALTVARGTRYRLTGTIDGEVVQAETTVPATFVIVVPANDTITEADGTLCSYVGFEDALCVPVVFDFDGPPAFEYRVQPTGEGYFALRYDGGFLFRRHSGIRTVTIFAFNSDAAEWLLRFTPRTNVLGAFGAFGAALKVRRTLVFEP